MGKSNRRPQATKGRNLAYAQGMQEIRFSNASGPHRAQTDYRRKPKHAGQGWGE